MCRQYMLHRYFIIILVALNLLLIGTDALIAEEAQDLTPNIKIKNNPELSIEDSRREITKLYSTIIPADEATIYTIKLNGLSTDIAPLPNESRVIELPENQYVYQSPEKVTNYLPNGTSLTYHESQPILIIPGQAIVLEVKNLEKYSIETPSRIHGSHHSRIYKKLHNKLGR